jgi:hypothetical protein
MGHRKKKGIRFSVLMYHATGTGEWLLGEDEEGSASRPPVTQKYFWKQLFTYFIHPPSGKSAI